MLLHKYGVHADAGKNGSGSLLECYHTVQTLVAENEGKMVARIQASAQTVVENEGKTMVR